MGWAKSGPKSTRLGPILTEFDQHLPGIDQISPGIGWSGFETDFGQNSANFDRTWPELDHKWRSRRRARAAKSRASSTESVQKSAESGPTSVQLRGAFVLWRSFVSSLVPWRSWVPFHGEEVPSPCVALVNTLVFSPLEPHRGPCEAIVWDFGGHSSRFLMWRLYTGGGADWPIEREGEGGGRGADAGKCGEGVALITQMG